jgi:hypothetical protein
MKGVVMQFRQLITPAVILFIMSIGFVCDAEANTIEAGHATVSWKGKGVIDDLGDGDRVFSGILTGTILVKNLPVGSEPAQIHKTKMDCQTILYISKTVEERKTILCILRPRQGKDLVYVEVRCAGKTGECKGEMTWVWGKGRWKGITGTTPFVAGIYIEEQKKGEVYGSAHWPELTYTLP